MDLHGKRRALVIIGAGASVEYGIPVTATFGSVIENAVRGDAYCQRTGGVDAYLDVANKLLGYYQNANEAHFERIYHVLHELAAFRDLPGAAAKFFWGDSRLFCRGNKMECLGLVKPAFGQ
ncbi:hypothetical protein EJD96_09025 [Herbaspirillum seropedicae]|uniref:hypothetical protein n=1 Tax=Herbaspirillum seropedicae TaxID=964 RepID=UPI001124A4D2|nr:hypothetical protein [Herbaspirillum seropedicae]QDD64297.1 hypothetical protein EJD96_09025 [Herbaspirillum seropedicae]